MTIKERLDNLEAKLAETRDTLATLVMANNVIRAKKFELVDERGES